MIYTFHNLIRAQPVDLSKGFDSLQTSPEVAKQIQHINNLRDNFYTTFDQIQSRPLKEVDTSLDWMPLFEYLTNTVELLNLGVKKANYPLSLNYYSFASPSKTIGINNGTIEL